jgi:L-2-hydroxyglutarate oxidase LhgO
MSENYDVVIGGAGVIGLSVARALLHHEPNLKILIVDKEERLGAHASGRNSGVLHAGFYYSPDSLKAKFCREGNLELRKLTTKHNIPVRDVGKVVVARNAEEAKRLQILYERGKANGVDIHQFEAKDLPNYEPLAVTHESFLWSPTTGVSDPDLVIQAINSEVVALGAEVRLGTELEVTDSEKIKINGQIIQARHFVNAAGTQSDRIAHKFGVGLDYTMIPFMGVYRAVLESKLPLQRLVYPVPHPLNPFLGVHFTLTVDHKVKIGPTAIPIFGREQYGITEGWSFADIQSTFSGATSMLRGTAHDLPALIRSEWPKVFTSTLVREATHLVPTVAHVKGWHLKPPGIRAQLVHRKTGQLEQDFLIAKGSKSTHILNVVSPGWTSAIPFATYAVEHFILGEI